MSNRNILFFAGIAALLYFGKKGADKASRALKAADAARERNINAILDPQSQVVRR